MFSAKITELFLWLEDGNSKSWPAARNRYEPESQQPSGHCSASKL